jgi:hypothetical protein
LGTHGLTGRVEVLYGTHHYRNLPLSPSESTPQNVCPVDAECSQRYDERHLRAFAHTGYLDIPTECEKGARCAHRLDPEHLKTHFHPRLFALADCRTQQLAVRAGIHFAGNQLHHTCKVRPAV